MKQIKIWSWYPFAESR